MIQFSGENSIGQRRTARRRRQQRSLRFEDLEDRRLLATFAAAGSQLNLNMNVPNRVVSIVSTGSSYALTLAGDIWSGANSPYALGAGSSTLIVTTAGQAIFDTINISDSASGTAVNFNNSGAHNYSDTFNVTLDNAAGTIGFSGNSSFVVGASLLATTSRNIVFSPGSHVTAAGGDLTFSANQQAVPTSGSFVGVDVNNATVQITGAGTLTLAGRGGDGAAGQQQGIFVHNGGLLQGGSTGSLVVIGAGGGSSGVHNNGVSIEGSNSRITSSGGSVSVSGIGGGVGASGDNYGVYVAGTGAIFAGGSGSVTVVGTGGETGDINPGVLVTGTDSQIASGGGEISVTGTGGAGASSFGIQATSSGEINGESSAPAVSLIADSMDLTSTESVQAGASMVMLRPKTPGTLIDLGGADVLNGSPLTLGLTDAELDRITAGAIGIGINDAGPISITGVIDAAGTDTLHLVSGSTVGHGAIPSGIVEGHLAIEAGETVNLNFNSSNGNKVEVLAIHSTSGNIHYVSQVGFTVGEVEGVAGISAATGLFQLVATTGDVHVSDTSAVNDLEARTNISVILQGDEAKFSLASNAASYTSYLYGSHDYVAAKMEFLGTITAGGASGYVRLDPTRVNHAVDLGSAEDTADNTLELSNAELDHINASHISIGNATIGGPINVTDVISLAGTDTLRLYSASTVSEVFPAGVVVDNLAVEAGDAVTLDNAANDVGVLAIRTTSGTVKYSSEVGFTVGEVLGNYGISTASGEIRLTTVTGDIVVSDTTAAHELEATGLISVSVMEDDARFTLASGANAFSNGASHFYQADNLQLDGTITAEGQTVLLRSWEAGQPIDVGSATDTAADTLELSDAELDRITAGAIGIGISNAGPISVTALIDPANADTLHLGSGSTVSEVYPSGIVEDHLSIDAGGAVTLDTADNDIGVLAVRTASGTVKYASNVGVTVGEVNGIAGISTGDGEIRLTAVTGDIMVSDTSAAHDLEATRLISASVRGDDAKFTLAAGADADSSGGNHFYEADKIDLAGTVTAPGSSVFLRPWNAGKAIDVGSTSDAAADTLELSNAELDHVTASLLSVGGTVSGPVTITDLIDPAGTDWLHLSGSTVSEGFSSGIVEDNLSVNVGGAVTLDTAVNDIGVLAIRADSGTIKYTSNVGVTVGELDGIAGISTGGGEIRLTALTGDITVSDTSAAHDLQATGLISVQVRGDDDAFTLDAGADSESAGGSHFYEADKIDLAGTVSAPGRSVFLRPWKAGQAIDIGSTADAAADTLELSDAELDHVAAGGLFVGTSTSGPVNITDLIDPAGTDTLHLGSSGAVSEVYPAGIVEDNLSIDAGGAVIVDTADNNIGVLAIRAASGAVKYTSNVGVTVGEVNGIAGISAGGGELRLTALTGDITVSDTSAANDLEATGLIAVAVRGDDAKFTLAAGAHSESAGFSHFYEADKIDLAGTIAAPGRSVFLRPWEAGDAIDVGSTADAAADTLELSDAELDRVTAGALFVGMNTSGPVSVTALIDPAGTDTLHLGSGSTVSEIFPSGIVEDNLSIDAGGAVHVDTADNNIGVLAIHSTSGAVKYTANVGVTVGEVNGIAGISAGGGEIRLTALTGDITVSDTSAANDLDATGLIAVAVRGDDAKFTLAAGAHSESAGFNHFYEAEKIDLAGTITAPGRSVFLRPWEAGDAIDVGSTADAAADTLELSDAELDRVTAGALFVGTTSSGPVSITSSIDPAGTDTLHLSGSEVSEVNLSGIVESNLSVNAGGAVTLDAAENDVSVLAIRAASGAVKYSSNVGVAVGELNGIAGISTADGGIRLTAVTGDITVSDTSAAHDLDATGLISVQVRGDDATFTLVAGADSYSSGGNHFYQADKMDLAGTIAAPGRTVFLRPWEAAEAIDLGSTADAAVDTLELSDAELDHVVADLLLVGSATSGSVSVTAPIDLAATSTLHLSSGGQVDDGASGSLSVSNLAVGSAGATILDNGNAVQVLAANVSGMGSGFHFENIGALTVGTVNGISGVTTNGGGITIVTHSPLTIDQPVTDTNGGSILLRASNDGGDDDHLTINAPIQALGGNGDIVLAAGTDLVINDSGADEVLATGDGSITATAERNLELSSEVDLVTTGGEVALGAGNAVFHGTAGDDDIHFSPGPNAGEIEVTLNGVSQGVFAVSSGITAYGHAGSDSIQVAGGIDAQAWLYGGDGDDRLKGGAGHDVLLGENGDDMLVGKSGRDILIGGRGSDRIVGNADEDILIAGWLSFVGAQQESALHAIQDEWLSTHDETNAENDHQLRIQNLSDGSGTADRLNDTYFLNVGEGGTVLDDANDSDVLTGSAGYDWFFFDTSQGSQDRATDLHDEVFANDLDWIET